MDEAHALKNAASSRARRLRRLALVGCLTLPSCGPACRTLVVKRITGLALTPSSSLSPYTPPHPHKPTHKQTARGRLMLTGTPLQNDLIELNNLLTFLLPNIFAGQGMGEFYASSSQGGLDANPQPLFVPPSTVDTTTLCTLHTPK